LKKWWNKARIGAFEPIIDDMTKLMEKHGLPLPPSLPELKVLTDQFMAVDGAAMVKGMIEAHVRGLQVARRPDVALLYNKLLQGALLPFRRDANLKDLPPGRSFLCAGY
jgi:hypothetical protein